MYLTAQQAPPRFQFESNSGSLWASQTQNCGPTCVTKIAQFYADKWFGIEATRKLATSCCIPTSAPQQRDMLIKRGVPAAVVSIDSIAQMRQLVSGGTRPIIVGVLMSRVPYQVRGHSFLGWHAVCVLGTAYVGTAGFWVNDPNFSPPGGIRPDPQQGRRFYSEAVMKHAFIDNAPRWSVVPTAHKRTYTSAPAPAPSTGEPMLNPKVERWTTLVDKAPVYDRIGGTVIRTLPLGTPISSLGETIGTTTATSYRLVLVEIGSGSNRLAYMKRPHLKSVTAAPYTEPGFTDKAFRFITTGSL